MVGTLEYMAPEVLLKQPGSFASDVYAFGVTVNEAATGVVPFSDCTRDNPKAHTILDMGYGRCWTACMWRMGGSLNRTVPDMRLWHTDLAIACNMT
jgi:serine/threonine protein kinase